MQTISSSVFAIKTPQNIQFSRRIREDEVETCKYLVARAYNSENSDSVTRRNTFLIDSPLGLDTALQMASDTLFHSRIQQLRWYYQDLLRSKPPFRRLFTIFDLEKMGILRRENPFFNLFNGFKYYDLMQRLRPNGVLIDNRYFVTKITLYRDKIVTPENEYRISNRN